MSKLWEEICKRNGWHPVILWGGLIAMAAMFLWGWLYCHY